VSEIAYNLHSFAVVQVMSSDKYTETVIRSKVLCSNTYVPSWTQAFYVSHFKIFFFFIIFSCGSMLYSKLTVCQLFNSR